MAIKQQFRECGQAAGLCMSLLSFTMSPSSLPSLTLASSLIKNAGGMEVKIEIQDELLLPSYAWC